MKSPFSLRLTALAAACFANFTATRAQTFNPTAAAQGFNVFTTGAVTIVGGDTHGPLAVGGNLVLAGSAPLVMNTSGRYPTGTLNSSGNYGLVINGQVVYQSGGNPTYVNQGLIRIANTTGTVLYDKDNNNANTDLQLTSGLFNSVPRVQKQNGWQDKTTATQPHGINFATAANDIAQASAIINSYAVTNCQSKINLITPPSCNSCNPTLTLMSNKVNFVNITTQAQLAALLSGGSLNVSPAPTATSPLIFNVTMSGTITWPVPNMAGIGGQDGPYILWNFPNAAGINFGGGAYNNSVYGTILAPQAAVVKDGGNNFEGQVLSASLSINTGEIHYQPFDALLPQCSVPLALENVALTASRQGTDVRVAWRTNGLADAMLSLERSGDLKKWTKVGSALRGHAFVDVAAPATRLYYRLRAQTEDGVVRYSTTALVHENASAAAIAISPNPFTHALALNGLGDASMAVLVDAAGRTLASASALNGRLLFEGLDRLPAGLYFVRITTVAGEVAVHKVVKQ